MPSAQNTLTGSNCQIRARGYQKRHVCGAGSKVCGAGIKVHPDRHTRGAEHAVRAKYVDPIKTSKSRAGTPKKACLRGGVKSLRGGNKSASGPPYYSTQRGPGRGLEKFPIKPEPD
ncbi:hypothetical protein B0H11DRAFT_1907634 [Mycena galericulata]|nr:hypothetical protein B0H11DRAFT_1907634 [Mycena galericulata]